MLTDDNLAVHLDEVWRKKGGSFLLVARRARELIAAEANPVATREAVVLWLNGPVSEPRRTQADLILAAITHFAPPAPERAPISGMSPNEIYDIICSVPANADDTWLSFVRRIAHRLAQPAPVVDPDAEAKRLYWCYYQASGRKANNNENAAWNYASIEDQDGWRAVAAAKGAGE